jgi:hypothetical protein
VVSLGDDGILYAPSVNELALRRTFAFLYLPTIIALVFSVYIVWIGIDAKRIEPFRQLSKAKDALGKDSLLLQYSFDFIPLVPYRALRRGYVQSYPTQNWT